MKKITNRIIVFYQVVLSPDFGVFSKFKTTCVFYPTCSEYTKQAIQKHGLLKGFLKGGMRVFRCHPWQKRHLDPLT